MNGHIEKGQIVTGVYDESLPILVGSTRKVSHSSIDVKKIENNERVVTKYEPGKLCIIIK